MKAEMLGFFFYLVPAAQVSLKGYEKSNIFNWIFMATVVKKNTLEKQDIINKKAILSGEIQCLVV